MKDYLIKIKSRGEELKIYKTELKGFCSGLSCNRNLWRICSQQDKEIVCNPLFDLISGTDKGKKD